MKKQLPTVGDSFTYGDELTDVYQAWPYRLADSLGYEVHNIGQSGCSNTSILRRTLEELAVNQYDLVVIGWTSPGRIEWKDDIWPGYSSASPLFQDHPWRTDLLNYISKHHNSAYLYQQYLIQVVSLQSYCKAKNIDYRMIDTRHNDYYRKVGAEMHDRLAEQIHAEMFIGWNKFGMIELTKGCAQGPGGHPLEKGHKRIADEIAKYIRN